MCLVLGCNTAAKKEGNKTAENKTKVEEKETYKSIKSADYSTLLTEYKCDMSISEVAEILEVPESDLSIAEYTTEGKCYFVLKGFGKNTLTGGTGILWGPSPSSKAQNKKEIKSYLEWKQEGVKIMGMDIALAETGDCYIAYQPAHGRLIIYNENYDTAFLINYGRKSSNNQRTDEQHEALRLKMTDLANYLLKKHRK